MGDLAELLGKVSLIMLGVLAIYAGIDGGSTDVTIVGLLFLILAK